MAARREAMRGPQIEVEAHRPREDSESLMERMLFEDEAKASQFLKGLISANGLRGAWATLSRRIELVEEAHKELWAYSSREVLEQNFVERDEYELLVVGKHDVAVKDHSERLGVVEGWAHEALANDERLRQQVAELSEAQLSHSAELGRLAEGLAQSEALESRRHEEALGLSRELEERRASMETQLRDVLRGLDERLQSQEQAALKLDETLKQQQAFLSSELLQDHIMKTCKEVLLHYVHKDEMKGEVCMATDYLLNPIKDELGQIHQDIEDKVLALAEKDRAAREGLEALDRRLVTSERALGDRINEVNTQLETRATGSEVRELEDHLNRMVQMSETAFHDLKLVTTKKVQEVVDRISEFQVILEDHEHALQHHAEELLNRSTKYDLVVCQQRVDKCAIKDKVDSDISDLRSTVTWQSMKLENLVYSKSFAGTILQQGPGQGLAVPGQGDSLERQTSAGGLSGPAQSTTSALVPQTSGSDGEGPAAKVSPRMGSKAKVMTAAQEAQQASGEPSKGTQESMEQASKSVQETHPPPPVAFSQYFQPTAMTEHCNLLKQQLESLAQAVLGMGHLSVRQARGHGLSREARQEREAELLHHLSCVLHWIMHRRAPARWEPAKLTTFALRALTSEPVVPSAAPTVAGTPAAEEVGFPMGSWPPPPASAPAATRGSRKARSAGPPTAMQASQDLSEDLPPVNVDRGFTVSPRLPYPGSPPMSAPAPGFRRRRPARSMARCTPVEQSPHWSSPGSPTTGARDQDLGILSGSGGRFLP